MLGAFNAPRVEGRFEGDRMSAWDVVWGRGGADLEIENGYVRVRDAVVEKGDGRLDVDGLFALGTRGATAERRSMRGCACRATRSRTSATRSASTTTR